MHFEQQSPTPELQHLGPSDNRYPGRLSGTINWAAVESLLLAAGARLIEGRGSRVRFEKAGEVATFHRSHPAKEAKRYQVRDARDFLERIGVKP